MKSPFIPEGFSVYSSIQALIDAEQEEQLAEERLEEFVWKMVSESPDRVAVKRTWFTLERGVVDGVAAWIDMQHVSVMELEVSPSNPSELASGHDWLSVIEDDGSKHYMAAKSWESWDYDGSTSETVVDFDPPMVHPADRYQGALWRTIPGAVALLSTVCNTCNLEVSRDGKACGC